VKAILIFFAVIFSGCAPAVQYIVQRCESELPVRAWDGVKCGSEGKNLAGKEFVVCVVQNDKKKDNDYENLKVAFESCK
jgi:hypothetical protein